MQLSRFKQAGCTLTMMWHDKAVISLRYPLTNRHYWAAMRGPIIYPMTSQYMYHDNTVMGSEMADNQTFVQQLFQLATQKHYGLHVLT